MGEVVVADGLSDKQQMFVTAYLDCLNATEAARRAGYAHPNVQGSRLLVNVSIAEAVRIGLKEKAMPADEVLARLAEMARADIRDLFNFNEDGAVEGLRLTRDAPLHLIRSITPTRYGSKIEVHDQQQALTTLGKYHKLWTEKIDLEVDVSKLSNDELLAILKGQGGG